MAACWWKTCWAGRSGGVAGGGGTQLLRGGSSAPPVGATGPDASGLGGAPRRLRGGAGSQRFAHRGGAPIRGIATAGSRPAWVPGNPSPRPWWRRVLDRPAVWRSLESLPDPYTLEQGQRFWLEYLESCRLTLALRLFRDASGSWPDRLDELAPGILTVVPTDPVTRAPFRYVRDGAAVAPAGSGRRGAGRGRDGLSVNGGGWGGLSSARRAKSGRRRPRPRGRRGRTPRPTWSKRVMAHEQVQAEPVVLHKPESVSEPPRAPSQCRQELSPVPAFDHPAANRNQGQHPGGARAMGIEHLRVRQHVDLAEWNPLL